MSTQLALFGDPKQVAEPKPKAHPPDKPNGVAINLRGAPPKAERFMDDGVEYKVTKGGALVMMRRWRADGGFDDAEVKWSHLPEMQGSWNWHATRGFGPKGELLNCYGRRVEGVATYTEAREGVLAFWNDPDPPERAVLDIPWPGAEGM